MSFFLFSFPDYSLGFIWHGSDTVEGDGAHLWPRSFACISLVTLEPSLVSLLVRGRGSVDNTSRSSGWRHAVWVGGSALTLKGTFPHPFLSELGVWPRVLFFSPLDLWEKGSETGFPGFLFLNTRACWGTSVPLPFLLSSVGIWGQNLDFCPFLGLRKRPQSHRTNPHLRWCLLRPWTPNQHFF